jgi:hypothetical protein
VPVIRPVVELMLRPEGNPVALYESVAPEFGSVAWTCTLTLVPSVLCCGLMAWMVMGEEIVHSEEAVAV